MTDILIRGISEATLQSIDSEAAALGLSRNEFLRRKLDLFATGSPGIEITSEDWERSAAAFEDLGDPDVMDAAWQ